jgi:MSHA pilin protein MshD
MSSRRQRGVTLVELIVAIVIVSVGLAGVLAALSRTTVASANPMVVKQMTAIAEGMMEEIQLRQFEVAAPTEAALNGCARNHFNDVRDYHGYAQPVCDMAGNALPLAAQMTVAVNAVAAAAGDSITAGNLPAADAIIIDVTVTSAGQSHVLRGWRTRY